MSLVKIRFFERYFTSAAKAMMRPYSPGALLQPRKMVMRPWRVFMSEVVYTSNVSIERIKGPLRRARLPGEPQPVMFSVHGGIAKHYGIDESRLPESHAATIDYVVAALGG
jgi:acetyl esterase/lipase